MLPAALGLSTEGHWDPLRAGDFWQPVERKGSPFSHEIHFFQGHRAGLHGQKQLVTCREGALDLLRDREAWDHPQQAPGLGHRVQSNVFPFFDFSQRTQRARKILYITRSFFTA